MILATVKDAVQRLVQWQLFVPFTILLVLVVRCVLAWLVAIELVNDPAAYHQYAIWLSEGKGYLDIPTGEPTAYWPIGYPAFLGGIYYLFGIEPLSGELANSLLSALVLWLAYDVARLLFNELTGRYLVLLLALYPAHWFFSLHLASEMLSMSLVLLTVTLTLRRGVMLTVLSGLTAGLAFLVKPQTVAIAGIVWLFAMGKEAGQYRSAAYWGKWLGMYCVLIIVATPWAIRNYQVFDHFVPVSTNGGINLYLGNNPEADGSYHETPEMHELIAIRDEIARDKEAKARLQQYLSENHEEALARIPAKLYALYGADFETSYTDGKVTVSKLLKEICNAYYYVLLLLSALGILALITKQGVSVLVNGQLVPLICALWFTFVYMLFFGTSRFHFLMIPMLTMYGAWLLAHWQLKTTDR